MKTFVWALVCSLLTIATVFARDDHDTTGTKSTLQWRTFDAGFAEAKKSGKKVLVDVFTEWCVWCKRLDKNVYGDSKVADYLNEHYITVKLNPETNTKVTYRDTVYSAAQFAQGFGVTGYPTILFFEPDGKPINRLGGYADANRFLPIIRYIGEDFYKKMSWDDFQKEQAGDQPGENKN
jgi:thioredoxin-related protein